MSGAGPLESGLLRRLRQKAILCLAILRGQTVLYRASLEPWAGPRPSDGVGAGWVRVSGVVPGVKLTAIDCHFNRPVFVADGWLEVPDDALPYFWRPEE